MNWKIIGFIFEIAVVVAAVVYGLISHVTIRTLRGRLATLKGRFANLNGTLANLNGTLATIKKNAEFDAEKNIATWDEMRKLRHEIDVSRQGINRRDKIIQERDGIIADMDEQVRELAEDTARMRDVLGRMEVLGQNLPERKAGDSDAKYLQRCRMAVITKAYEYVQVVDGMALLTVIAPKEDEDVITGATAMEDNCGNRVGGYKGTRIEGPKTSGLNMIYK